MCKQQATLPAVLCIKHSYSHTWYFEKVSISLSWIVLPLYKTQGYLFVKVYRIFSAENSFIYLVA